MQEGRNPELDFVDTVRRTIGLEHQGVGGVEFGSKPVEAVTNGA